MIEARLDEDAIIAVQMRLIQELKAENDELRKQVSEQKKQYTKLNYKHGKARSDLAEVIAERNKLRGDTK